MCNLSVCVVIRYESVIATLCENLDSLDEPEARAAMIWIVGEYAERIDNADELLESFLEGFHDESTQVQLTLQSTSSHRLNLNIRVSNLRMSVCGILKWEAGQFSDTKNTPVLAILPQ